MANLHFNMNSVTSTTQSAISNEDFDGEAAASTTDFNRRATSTPPGLGREILHQPETPGRVPSRGRGLLFHDTPSPTPGIFDDIDPWERDVTSTNNVHSWGNLASRREIPTHAQLDICERIEREHEANILATQFLEWEMEKYHATQWYTMELELLRMQYNTKIGNLRRGFVDTETYSDLKKHFTYIYILCVHFCFVQIHSLVNRLFNLVLSFPYVVNFFYLTFFHILQIKTKTIMV